MPTYSVSKTWNAAETLTAADLNGIESQVATFLNTTKLDGDNISATATYTFGGIVLGTGGPASPDGGNLHSFNGDASAAAHADADEGVFENSAAVGISLLGGASSAGNIFFGDTGDNDIGKISYSHSTDAMTLTTNATTALTLSSAQLATFAGAIQANSTVTVGADDTGYDVQMFGATAGAHLLWDESADTLKLVGGAATDMQGTLTVGVDDTGYDVKFFGATTGKYMLWDESADTLAVVGTAITLNGTAVGDASVGTANTWTADQTFNDNVKVTLGTGGDADLYYDATNVVLNPKVVGSGVFNVLGEVKIGSGIATPNVNGDNLVINGSGNTGMSILGDTASAASIIYLGYDGDEDSGRIFYQNSATTPFMDFYVKDTQVMRITSAGGFLVNRTTHNTNFRVNIDESAQNIGMLGLDHTSSTSGHQYGMDINFSAASPDNNTNWAFRFRDSTTTRAQLDSDGDWNNHDGVYGTISDVKYKQDIVDMRSYWDDFASLQYRKFRHKTDVEADEDAPHRVGLIAQEVETVFPNLVAESPDDKLDPDNNEVHKTVKSSIIEGPIMASVVQELQQRVEALEAV